LALGSQLGTLQAVHNLVRQAAGTCSIEELLERFSRQLGLGDQYPRRYRVLLLESLLTLIAHARRTTTKLDGSPVVLPWLNLRVQLWLREIKFVRRLSRNCSHCTSYLQINLSCDLVQPLRISKELEMEPSW
jgi:hypothetical protein